MNIFLNLLSAALYVMLFQNLIFNGGYGLSEAVRMSAKPRQLLPMAVFITLFSTVVSAICVLIDFFPVIHNLNEIYHALIYVGILLVIYIITMIIANIIPRVQPATKRRIGIAAFNTLVLAMPLINYRSAFNVIESIGAGLGAGLAYIIAVILINSGLKRLDTLTTIPKAFKGTPAIFIYTALLSLAFTGISGTSIFI
jgi:Na+-translocating ferredoxin:NAD+ oxidoreductase RnfA subunit